MLNDGPEEYGINWQKHMHVNNKLQDWYHEGKKLPDYEQGHGTLFLANLLGCDINPFNITSLLHWHKWLDENHPHILDSLLGPHGWAILNVLIARKEQRDGTEATT
jgi:hypothetical protein